MAQDNFNIGKFLKESVKNSYTNQVVKKEEKELLNENFVGLQPINTIPPRDKENYELAFDKYLGEEVNEEKTHEEMEEDMQIVPVGVDNKIDHSNHGIDDEGRMAKSQLYKIAKYASELYKMMDDNTQLDAWVQAKLTKACDYVGTVKHYLEGEEAINMLGEKKDDEHKG
jgi:hypothetical protein